MGMHFPNLLLLSQIKHLFSFSYRNHANPLFPWFIPCGLLSIKGRLNEMDRTSIVPLKQQSRSLSSVVWLLKFPWACPLISGLLHLNGHVSCGVTLYSCPESSRTSFAGLQVLFRTWICRLSSEECYSFSFSLQFMIFKAIHFTLHLTWRQGSTFLKSPIGKVIKALSH